MTEIRALFMAAVEATTPLLADPALADRFEGPSALAEFSVRGLAGHLLRATATVEGYLDAPEPAAGRGSAAQIVSAADYYTGVLPAGADLHSDLNRAIRQRGLESAPEKAGELGGLWAAAGRRLRLRLEAEAPGRLVEVYGGTVLTLDEYLVTRLVELVVHADDLAVSLDVDPPPLPPAATGLVITTLVEVGRIRHGDTAVVRALARRERDTAGALRVI